MPVIAVATVLLVIPFTCKLPIDIISGNHINTKHKNNRQTVYNQISVGNKAYELAVQRSKNRKMKEKGRRDRGAGPLYPGDTKFI